MPCVYGESECDMRWKCMYLHIGSPFADCLDSVKQILGILGRIHDLDINLPVPQTACPASSSFQWRHE